MLDAIFLYLLMGLIGGSMFVLAVMDSCARVRRRNQRPERCRSGSPELGSRGCRSHHSSPTRYARLLSFSRTSEHVAAFATLQALPQSVGLSGILECARATVA